MNSAIHIVPYPDGKGVEVLILAFSKHQEARGFSPNTVKRRTTTLQAFARLLEPSGFDTATPDDVQEFLLRYKAPRTRHAYRSDLAAFYKWACRRRLLSLNPMELIDPVKVPKSLPRPVPTEMVTALMATANAETRLMIALAAYAGMRISEIAALTAEDIDFQRNALNIRQAKGQRDRQVPLHPLLRRLLEPYMFRQGSVFELKKDTIGRRITRHMQHVGVNATPHKLRASFATELADVSKDVLLVQKLLGHESPNTTMAYVQVGMSGAGDMVARMYPPAS